MFLSDAQRKYIVNDHIIGSGVFNVSLNALFGWLSFRKHDPAPLRGDPSILNDAIATAVLLPLLICLIVTPLVRKRVRSGKLEPITGLAGSFDMLLWLPSGSFLRGSVLSLLCLAWLTPVYLGLLMVFGVTSLSAGSFVVVKGLYAGLAAALVAPVVALYAMATTQPGEEALALGEAQFSESA